MSQQDAPYEHVFDGGALEPAEPVIPPLPILRNEAGLEVVDWQRFLPEKADFGKASSLIQYEVQALAAIDSPHAQERADRISRASDAIIDRVDNGQLATMQDVSTMIDFVSDNNPSLKRVGEFLETGRTIQEVTEIYSARETIGVSLGAVDSLCEAFGIARDDEEMLELLSDAVDAVIAHRSLDWRFRDIGAQIAIELANSGMTLAGILDLPARG